MIAQLKEWFNWILHYLEFDWWKDFKDAVWGWFKSFATVATVIGGLFTSIMALFDPGTKLHQLATTINTTSGNVRTLPGSTLIAQLNHIFPLQEALAFMIAFLLLKLAVLGILVLIWIVKMVAQVVKLIMSAFGHR